MSIMLSCEQRSLRLDVNPITIGRAPDNLLAFPNDARLAAYHAVLKCVGGRWIVEGLGSSLIRVGNGRPVQFSWLQTGDILHLSDIGPDVLFQILQDETIRKPNGPVDGPVNRTTVRQVSAYSLTRNQVRGLLAGGVAGVTVILLSIVLWLRQGQQTLTLTAGLQPTATATRPLEPVVPAVMPRDPSEYLVLIGIGNLREDHRPHLLGVGWLWTDRIAVVSRTLGETLSALLTASEADGESRQACVIQGVALEVAKITHPERCPHVSLLRIAQPAHLSAPAATQWRRITAVEVERLRARGQQLRYASYGWLPRSGTRKGNHDMSLVAYDPEVIRPKEDDARLLYEQRRHLLRPPSDDRERLELGGLLFDESRQLVGMTLWDSSIIWFDELHLAFESP